MWVATFAVSGAFAGLTGILYLGFTGKASGTVGEPLLFQTIAAVVIGGTSLMGGMGGYARTVIGAIVLILLGTLLLAQGVQSTLIQAATGVLIITLVTIYGREAKLRDTI
jgi:ribose transport system permease protein